MRSIGRMTTDLAHLCLLAILSVIVLGKPSPAQDSERGAKSSATDFRGTWTGTFFSKHPNVAPFSMTIVISQDDTGTLKGDSSLNSDCLKNVKLTVTSSGSKVVLAGSDEEGDNITVRGTVDSTGNVLKATYILNGSATGRCETDDGSGKLARR